MFNMYDTRPKNSEEECRYPETPCNPILLEENTVLNEIEDICRIRCEYHHELIAFFNSELISEKEKNERFRSLHPTNPNIILEQCIETWKQDLSVFYIALQTISKYKNKEYPKYFPIFIELSEFFKTWLHKEKDQPTLKACFEKLQPYLHGKTYKKFNNFFKVEFKEKTIHYNNELTQIGVSLLQKIRFFLEKHDRLASQCQPELLFNTGNPITDRVKLLCEIQFNKREKNIARVIQKLMILEKKITSTKNSTTHLHHTLSKTITRRFAYKILYLTEKIEYHLAHLLTPFNEQEKAAIYDIARLIMPQSENENNVEPILEQLNQLTTQEISSRIQEITPPATTEDPKLDNETSNIDTMIEEDAFRAYAEFRELRAKKSQRRNFSHHNATAETQEQPVIAQLQVYHLQKKHLETLESIFTIPVPHYQIKLQDLKSLIEKIGGSLKKDTGSSRMIIRLASFSSLVDNPHLIITQRGIHKVHQSEHNESTVSRWYVNIFRTALERTGITATIIANMMDIISNSKNRLQSGTHNHV